MKKNIIVLFFVLTAFAIYFFLSQKVGTLADELENFQVKDTAEIDQILILDTNDTLILQRNETNWKINKKFIARKEAIYNALKIFTQFQIQSPVPNSQVDSVKRNLKTNFIELQLFVFSKKVKSFKISLLQEKLGTFALAEKSENPMILHVPGMNTNLTTYFSTNSTFWRTKTVFDYQPSDIKSIAVIYPSEKEKSFLIDANENFSLKDYDNKQINNFSMEKIKNYFSLFRAVEYKNLLLSQNSLQDSILRQTPTIIFEITDQQNQKNTLKLYEKFNNDKLDFNLMFGLQDDKTFFEITYFSLDPVLKTKNYFQE